MSMIGKTLGSFTLEAQIGKGGMGEVYRAKDQKLGRDVAIKVLPEEFAKDADRVARFQREAKLLASLNHPNIASIYGLEESGGTHFLVLELIEGDTLADRLKRGAIPVEESLKLALQIAEALEAAHEKGVIHRDLKPANIKVTPDGKVKVLDFGLAKAFAGEQAEVNLSHSPTLSEAATLQGVILGTAAYMSPEQARGKPVDKRTDIWAFGCVIYEMLTGKAAFQGEDVTEVLAAVVKSGVNLDLLPANIHPRVCEVITRCLQKDLKDRYRDIGDAQFEIKQVLADPSGVFVQPVTTAKPKKKLRLGIPWVAAIAILCLIIAGLAVWYLKPLEPQPVYHFYYDLPEDQELPPVSYGRYLNVSADGTKIVYVANGQLYLKNSNELTARPIKGTDENPIDPFFSPDGQWIAYFSTSDNYQLKRISVMGGTSATLCEVNGAGGATWGENGMIVFGQDGAIMRISADGGTPEEIVKGEEGQWFVQPEILPDGRSVLFSIQEEGGFQVAVHSLESGEQKVLFPGWPAQYLPTGHLVYGLENTLTAIRFDLDNLEPIAGSITLVEGVFQTQEIAPSQFAVSDSGTLVYYSGPPSATFGSSGKTLVWVNKQGKEELLDKKPNAYYEPRISPDGNRAALAIETGGNSDIWIRDLVRGTMTRLTLDEAAEAAPVWSPDGQRIAFLSTRDSAVGGMFCKAADGTGDVEFLGSLPDQRIIPWSWSKDGKAIVYMAGGASMDIGMMSMEGDRAKAALLQGKQDEYYPKLSPDGRWLAYQSDESGQEEVYVRSFPDVNKSRFQVSNSGGFGPLWSPDGRELFYWNGDAVMAVTVETEPTFKHGTPRMLFQGTYYAIAVIRQIHLANWDISPDGKRFLIVKPTQTEEESREEITPRINIVLNWFEELRGRVPVD